MNAIILAEGGSKIGFGHITRCSALRDALISKGIATKLIVNGDNLIRTQFRGQIDQIINWLKPSTLQTLINQTNIVIIDSYLASLKHYQLISKHVAFPVFIDDFVRLNYPTGIILAGAIGAQNFNYPTKAKHQSLLGPQFVLLRPAFWQVPRKYIRREIRKILITAGGVDRSQFILRLISHLSNSYPDIQYHIISSKPKYYQHLRNAKAYTNLNDYQIRNLMIQCDIAISGGGQTLNEMAACGLPVIGVCFAQNQKLNLTGWKHEGFLLNAGWFETKIICRKIGLFLQAMTYNKRRNMSRLGRQLIDGKGALRAAKKIIQWRKTRHA